MIKAAERAAGWRTVQVEWAFRVPLGPLELRGKIDRIDRHPDGRVRVIDYKTGDTARIKRAAMGSYMATFNRGRSIRVKRVD